MNKNITATIMVLLLIGIMANVSAVQYAQTKVFKDNDTVWMRTYYTWDIGDLLDDHIKNGNDLEAYIRYDVYTSAWNKDNPDYAVDNCNFTVEKYSILTKNTSIIYNRVFTGATTDVSMAKYFVSLRKGEFFTSDVKCKFSGLRPELMEMPFNLAIVTPTWECKACQSYEQSKLDINIEKAQTIGDNTVETIDYMKQLIILNFEFVVIFFWIFLISIGWFSMSLIFLGVYWLYLYLRKVSKIT